MTRREDILSSDYYQRLGELQLKLDYQFNQLDHLISALIHKSFYNENQNLIVLAEKYNERLEFLGDALLDFSISQHLFNMHTEASEGQLSKLRSSLVNEETLYQIAQQLELQDLLLMGNGERKKENNTNVSIMANTVEAIIGAIIKDANPMVASTCVLGLYRQLSHVKQNDLFALENLESLDAKSKLQELCHQELKVSPHYISTEVGSGADLEFQVSLVIDGSVVAETKGKSKKSAEKELAKLAIDKKLYLTNQSEVKHVN